MVMFVVLMQFQLLQQTLRTGLSDVDGDAAFATFVATKSKMLTHQQQLLTYTKNSIHSYM